MKRSLLAAVAFASLLTGCDMLGIDSPEKVAAAKDADGRAIGAACRQAGRAIEDCYTLNKRAEKASVFAGWRDMNDYMRENKIAEVVPQLSGPGAMVKQAGAKPDEKSDAKADAKSDMKVAEIDEAAASRPASGKARAKPSKDAKEAKSAVETADKGS